MNSWIDKDIVVTFVNGTKMNFRAILLSTTTIELERSVASSVLTAIKESSGDTQTQISSIELLST